MQTRQSLSSSSNDPDEPTPMKLKETIAEYPPAEKKAALEWLKEHQSDGAVYLVLNVNYRSLFTEWSRTAEAKKIMAGKTPEDWNAIGLAMKWQLESPEQIVSRIELHETFMECLDKNAKLMYDKNFKINDILSKMMQMKRAGALSMTLEKKQEVVQQALNSCLFLRKQTDPYLDLQVFVDKMKEIVRQQERLPQGHTLTDEKIWKHMEGEMIAGLNGVDGMVIMYHIIKGNNPNLCDQHRTMEFLKVVLERVFTDYLNGKQALERRAALVRAGVGTDDVVQGLVTIEEDKKPLPDTGSASREKDICRNFNTPEGCHYKGCRFRHVKQEQQTGAEGTSCLLQHARQRCMHLWRRMQVQSSRKRTRKRKRKGPR